MDTRGALVSLFFRMPVFNTREDEQMRAIRAPCAQDVSECARYQPEGIVTLLLCWSDFCVFVYMYIHTLKIFFFFTWRKLLVKEENHIKFKRRLSNCKCLLWIFHNAGNE